MPAWPAIGCHQTQGFFHTVCIGTALLISTTFQLKTITCVNVCS